MATYCRVNTELAGPGHGDSASATIYPHPYQDTNEPNGDVELPSPPAPLNQGPWVEQGTSKTSKLAVSIPASREVEQGRAIELYLYMYTVFCSSTHTVYTDECMNTVHFPCFRGRCTNNCVCTM